MIVGEIYQIRDYQTWSALTANPYLNVYHYQVATGDPSVGANAVVNAFIVNMLPALIGIQSDQMYHNLIEVINLDNPADFDSGVPTTLQGTGTRAGNSLPASDAWSFIYNRATRAVRNGWKRIGRVAESDQVNGFAEVAFVPALNVTAAAMGAPLSVGIGTIVPRIVRVTGPTGGPFTYTAFPISSVSFRHLGTQDTRKR